MLVFLFFVFSSVFSATSNSVDLWPEISRETALVILFQEGGAHQYLRTRERNLLDERIVETQPAVFQFCSDVSRASACLDAVEQGTSVDKWARVIYMALKYVSLRRRFAEPLDIVAPQLAKGLDIDSDLVAVYGAIVKRSKASKKELKYVLVEKAEEVDEVFSCYASKGEFVFPICKKAITSGANLESVRDALLSKKYLRKY